MSFGRYDQSKARAQAALTSDWSDDNHAFIVKVAQWSKLPTNDFVRTQSGTQALAARNVINDMTEHGFALTPFGFSESWDVWYGREDPISGIFVPFPDDWLLSAAMGAMGRYYQGETGQKGAVKHFPAHWETETWVISPESLYWSAVDMVDPVEANTAHEALVEASEQVADAIRDEYGGTGHGIGTSDRYNFTRAVVQSAGLHPKGARKANPKKERMYLWHYHYKGVAYFGLGPNPRIARRMLDQQLDGIGKSSASKGVQQYEIDYNKLSGDGWSSEI